ncbi:MAG TPA: hypothetical protein VKF79_09905 [Candidatus Acidoferrum sp.]|nr:hypothetical protein [Candidatus Acidoferrum sp.]
MRSRRTPLMILALLAFAPSFIIALRAAPESLAELQERFDREESAVHKAKMMQKLGDAQFDALHAAEKAEDYNSVGVILEKYRDNVRAALSALKKEHPDAERKSNGYRQLQIHLHRGVREVEDALRSSPDEFRPPLELVRHDLTAMDDEMLRLLFPARPDTKPAPKAGSKPNLQSRSQPQWAPKPWRDFKDLRT